MNSQGISVDKSKRMWITNFSICDSYTESATYENGDNEQIRASLLTILDIYIFAMCSGLSYADMFEGLGQISDEIIYILDTNTQSY